MKPVPFSCLLSKVLSVKPLHVSSKVWAGVLALLMWGCTTIPETGRQTFNLLPETQLAAMADGEFQLMKQEVPVSRDPALNQLVRNVGFRVVNAARARGAVIPPPEQWEFVVFQSDELNAFALPGGKVGFYTGILRLMEREDDIAVVMGHEVAHVVARHGNERVSGEMVRSGIATGGQVALNESKMDPQMKALIVSAYGIGTNLGFTLPYSRLHEAEADKIGLIYSSSAGYDPRRSIVFWEKMASMTRGSETPEFLSTHPDPANRIEALRTQLPSVMTAYETRRRELEGQP